MIYEARKGETGGAAEAVTGLNRLEGEKIATRAEKGEREYQRKD